MSVSLRALIEDRFSYFGEFSFRTMSCTAHCTDYKINEFNLSTKYSHVSTSPWAVNLREIIENTSSKNVRRKRKNCVLFMTRKHISYFVQRALREYDRYWYSLYRGRSWLYWDGLLFYTYTIESNVSATSARLVTLPMMTCYMLNLCFSWRLKVHHPKIINSFKYKYS